MGASTQLRVAEWRLPILDRACDIEINENPCAPTARHASFNGSLRLNIHAINE
jgi:hypothetical protein